MISKNSNKNKPFIYPEEKNEEEDSKSKIKRGKEKCRILRLQNSRPKDTSRTEPCYSIADLKTGKNLRRFKETKF
jgi:hypothetical protein